MAAANAAERNKLVNVLIVTTLFSVLPGSSNHAYCCDVSRLDAGAKADCVHNDDSSQDRSDGKVYQHRICLSYVWTTGTCENPVCRSVGWL